MVSVRITDRAALAQSVERLTRNEKVASSILASGSNKIPGQDHLLKMEGGLTYFQVHTQYTRVVN